MISMQDVYGAFLGSFGLNVRVLSEICQVRTIELMPKQGSLLHVPAAPAATCRIPLDTVIAPPVIVGHAWQGSIVQLVRAMITDQHPAITLIDIGANTGLFTRQLLGGSSRFRRAFAYEPHPGNFECLCHNLRPFSQVEARHVALGPEAATMAFHIDPENAGNYSLTETAMPEDRPHTTINVPVLAVATEAATWLATGLPLFYKSDTQGFDEIIAAAIPMETWARVVGGLMELWRIRKPAWPAEQLAAMLDRFAHKRFSHDPGTPVSTAAIMEFATGTDGGSVDLLFWNDA